MNFPRVSIVTPSYNQKNFIENTILSVLEQGYPDLEYLVMDGGSTDGSVEIIRKYAKYLTYWQSQPDAGQVDALNTGFRKASGQIFAFLNSDDFLLQGAIQNVVEFYDKYPRAVGWVGGGHSIAQDGFIIHSRLPKKLERDELANWEENWFYQPGCFFSADIARTVGFFNQVYENAFDFDFWLRITSLGSLIPIPKIIAAATIHPNTKTQKYQTRMFEEVRVIQQAYGYDSFAEITQTFIDRSRSEKPISAVARLMYLSQLHKQKSPGRFVRLPDRLKNV